MMKLNLLSKSLTLVLTALLMAFGMSDLVAQTQKIDVLPTSGTFTVPCGVTSVKVRAVGGGGGGGVRGNSGGGSAGGGGGAYAEITTFSVTPGQSMTYTVGAGGNGAVNNSPGGITTVTYGGTVVLRANGGGGGDATVAGSGGLAGTLGNINNAGGTGANGNAANTGKAAGGGGGAGSSVGKGNNATGITGGAASGTYGGKGGDGNDLGVGFAGGSYGGGGGGSVGAAAGNGGSGVVVIEYTLPPSTVIQTQPASTNYCQGQTPPVLTVAATGSNLTYQWYSNSSPSNTGGAQIPQATGTSFQVPVDLNATTRYFYVVVSSQCGQPIASNVATVTAFTKPIITSQPQPQSISYCSSAPATALSVTATGVGNLTYQWYKNTVNSTANATLIQTATAATYTTPAATNQTVYYFVKVIGQCSSTESNIVEVGVGAENIWNGTTWSKTANSPNMPGYTAVIDGDYNTLTNGGSIVSCNCTVNSGKTLTIGANTHLIVDKNLVNNGSLIVESDGNLLQKDATVVNGTSITVKRNFTLTEGRKEYNFISSPVKGQNMKLIFGSATGAIPYVTVYNEATDYFVNAKATDYDIEGRGFSVKEPTKLAVPLNNAIAVYNGFPNNGSYSVTLPYSGQNYGFNVVGNPYPSNIDINLLTAANSDNIESTIRFWDNTVNRTYSQQGSNYNQSAYATYNPSTGAVPAPGYDVGTGTGNQVGPAGSKTPSNIVKVDQAFMIQAKKAGAITFNNNMRVTTNGSVFFGKEVGRDAFHLEMVTPTGKGMQNAFAYVPEIGSVKFGEEDSETYNYYASDALYSILEDSKVIIDGRGAFSTDDVITLGTSHFSKGLHTIRTLDLQGIFANGQAIYLKDNVTKVITDISKKAYTFEAAEGESNNRFEILYQTESLGTDNVVKSGLVVYKEGGGFIVRGGKKMRSVELYDAVGRLVKTLPATTDTLEIAAESLTPGIYVVKVKYDDSTTQTKKVLK